MATKEQIEAAGNAYWNHYRAIGGHAPEARFKLDPDFANAIEAALDAAARVVESQDDNT